jgi:NAD(P)H-nitrite reductase large subunit
LERTYKWVPRLGIEAIRAVVVDDADGIADRLDANMAKSVGAYRDPWLDGRTPRHRRAVPDVVAVAGAPPGSGPMKACAKAGAHR